MNNMEKKIYSRPAISETRLDSEIILMQASLNNIQTEPNGFINPISWLKK